MLLVCYDISNDKLRTKFSKFLEKFGYRIQYSIFEIDNSKRILNVIEQDIEKKFIDRFGETDSVMIIDVGSENKITKYGYIKHRDEDFIIL